MIYTESISKIAESFKKLNLVKNVKYGYDNSIYNIVESVLSLNRDYDNQVIKMVNRFKEEYPEIKGINQFICTFDNYKESDGKINFREYARAFFGCYEVRKAEIIYNLVLKLKFIVKDVHPQNEFNVFSEWAKKTKPEEVYILNIKNFKIAGFQYMRMLFGADTVKPDRRIMRYVNSILGDGYEIKDELVIIKLFEDAAEEANIPVIILNNTVWNKNGNN